MPVLNHFENLHKKTEIIDFWESKPLFYKLENNYQTCISYQNMH